MDKDYIQRLSSICRFQFALNKEGSCTDISFFDDNELLGSTIRRHPDKSQILHIVSELQELQNVQLSKCRFDSIPEFKSRNLVSVDLSCNNLTEIPSWLNQATLRHLNLGANRIKEVPSWVGQLPLEVLKLHKNSITELPTLSPTLKVLNLYLNKMEVIPHQDLPLLENFAFGATKTKTVPALWKNLKWLTLVANRIERLPEDFCELSKLEGVRLAKNWLGELPVDIGKMNLRQLTLYSNHLKWLPESFFDLQLEKLNVSGNPLDEGDRERVRAEFSGIKFLEV